MRERAKGWMKMAAALLAVAGLPACSTVYHSHEPAAGGSFASATSSSISAGAIGNNYAIAASFGRPVPPTAPGGHLAVSSGSAAAVLVLGIVIVNAIDYLAGGAARGVAASSSANRPIAHTCSCYGYRPDQDSQAAAE